MKNSMLSIATALALLVLSAVLDGYDGARLERHLVQTRLADSAGSGADVLGRGPGAFLLIGTPAKGQTPAALEAGYTPETQVDAPDGLRLPGSTAVLNNAGSCGGTRITLMQALQVSCNTAFANIGLDLGDDVLGRLGLSGLLRRRRRPVGPRRAARQGGVGHRGHARHWPRDCAALPARGRARCPGRGGRGGRRGHG